MRRAGIALNVALLVLGPIGLVGHSRVRVFDGESWFAALVTAGAAANRAPWPGRARAAAGG